MMDFRNLATGDGGVSNPTDTGVVIRDGGVWRKCAHCGALAYNAKTKRCVDCEYGYRCESCNAPLRPTDPHAPTACSDTCAADLADQTEWTRT